MVELDRLHFTGQEEGQGSPPRSAQRLIASIGVDVPGESSEGERDEAAALQMAVCEQMIHCAFSLLSGAIVAIFKENI